MKLKAPSNVPDNTAVRTALWRALHVEQDDSPHVFCDTVGLQLISPDEDWRARPDMGPFTKPFRASILARARFIEDLLESEFASGVMQYVILGAGLDTFTQRKPERASRMKVFEIDQRETQEWKSRRLIELQFGIPPCLKLVPVDFEEGVQWWEALLAAGFDGQARSIVSAMGVSMYLTHDAVVAMLKQAASLAKDSTFVMSFLLPIELVDPLIRMGVERAAAGARASGTPWLSFFTPAEIIHLAKEAGFREIEHISSEALADRYFSKRTDGLRPPKNSEELLLART